MSKYAVPILSLAMGAFGGTLVSYVSLQPTTPGVKESGNINVSGSVIAGKVLVGLNSSASMITAYSSGGGTTAIQGSSKNFGIRGQSSATSGLAYGGYFDTPSPDGYGAWIRNKATGTGVAYGLLCETDALTGTGGYFRANSTASEDSTGLRGESLSNSLGAIGVRGEGNRGYGVYGVGLGSNGWGGSFRGDSVGIGATSTNGKGASFVTSNMDQYGSQSYAPPGGTGHALYASGTFAASGTKSLMIDHPDDPENKYLLQFCTEGDTPQLQYRGTVTLDSNGSAVVELPHYFEEINRDPTYQLTPVGASMPNLYVAQKVKNNRFRVAGGKAGMEVSWQVTGIRNDRFVRKYGARTEREKPLQNRGTYLMPDLYGKSEELREGFSEKEALLVNRSSTIPPSTSKTSR